MVLMKVGFFIAGIIMLAAAVLAANKYW